MKVGVLFGGRSVEHNISVISARAVADALRAKHHECVYIRIDQQGAWHLMDAVVSPDVSATTDPNIDRGRELMLVPAGGAHKSLYLPQEQKYVEVDVIFPVLHGSYGEDGIIQGTLDACTLRYVGGGVIPSVLTNDKDITKRLLRESGIAIAEYFCFRKNNDSLYAGALNKDEQVINKYYDEISSKLQLPFWIKPANLGSSLGISQVTGPENFIAAILEAFALDDKIIVEEHLEGREMECSVLEDKTGITVSLPGEIILNDRSFYDYDAKYTDKDAATLAIPADVTDDISLRIKEVAAKVFMILENRHIMRLDIFLTKEDKIIVNEVQTIPGFTSISMYPKLLDVAGVSLPELVDRLVVATCE
ncbi:MAG: D-alanine--D-alanine ligase [Gammaproteobacteria bacterium]|nr:D-alanine--D-alanine ligase [Gammaproteobacteria bacterium]